MLTGEAGMRDEHGRLGFVRRVAFSVADGCGVLTTSASGWPMTPTVIPEARMRRGALEAGRASDRFGVGGGIQGVVVDDENADRVVVVTTSLGSIPGARPKSA